MNELRKSDPVREAMRAVMGQWHSIFGSQSVTSAEVINAALETNYLGGLSRADFRELVDGCVRPRRHAEQPGSGQLA